MRLHRLIRVGFIDAAQFTAETIDEAGDTGRAAAIAVSSTGAVHVVYRGDEAAPSLRHAWTCR